MIPAPMQQRFTQYDIEEIPASGTFGMVCIARAPDGHKVAIKVLHLDRGTQLANLQRARDEARMLSRLDHPNLVRVEPVLQVNGRPCIIMEYVEGLTVAELLRARPQGLPAPIALAILRDAARGLEAAWSTPSGTDNQPMQVVHRDIKPGNLMVSIHGQVKVVDFGLAKATFDDREAHSTAFVPGSRGYMAPERYDGLDTPLGDVYALGLTLIEVLSGHKPLLSLRLDRHDAMLADNLDRLLQDGPDGVDLGGVDLDRLRALCLHLCAYEPSQRAEVTQVITEIDAILDPLDPAPDLTAFAAHTVAPLHAARTRLEPSEHPRYSDLRFLEVEPTHEAQTFDPNSEVRRFVQSDDFPTRASELAALLVAHPTADLRPLIKLLDGASAPPWQFWRRPPPREHTLAALRAIGHRATPTVLDRARRLTRHADHDIARAARELLEQADVPR